MAGIARIECSAVGPDVPRTTWASMDPQFMALNVVRIWDSDGAEGIGAAENYAANRFDLSTYEAIRALAPGSSARKRLTVRPDGSTCRRSCSPRPRGAVAAIDIALWDLAAR